MTPEIAHSRRRVLARLGLDRLVGVDPIDIAEGHLAHAASLAHPARYEVEGLIIDAPAGVYHPDPDSSSRMVLRNLQALNLDHVGRALEIGTGSGVVALSIARAFAADVLATDVSPVALAAAQANAALNGVALRAQRSDLFDDVAEHDFDLVVFNTPLIDQAPVSVWDAGTLCDPGGDLLERFARNVGEFLAPDGLALFSICANSAYERLDRVDLAMSIVGFEMAGAGFWRAILAAQG